MSVTTGTISDGLSKFAVKTISNNRNIVTLNLMEASAHIRTNQSVYSRDSVLQNIRDSSRTFAWQTVKPTSYMYGAESLNKQYRPRSDAAAATHQGTCS